MRNQYDDDNDEGNDLGVEQFWRGLPGISDIVAWVYSGGQAIASNAKKSVDDLISFSIDGIDLSEIRSDLGVLNDVTPHSAEVIGSGVLKVESIAIVPKKPSHVVARVLSANNEQQTFVLDMRIPRGMKQNCQEMANIMAGLGPIKEITIGLANAKQVETLTPVNQETSSSLVVSEDGHRAATLEEVKHAVSMFLPAMAQGIVKNTRQQATSILHDDKESNVSVVHEKITESTSQGRADQTQQRSSHDGHQPIQQGDNMMGTLDPEIVQSLKDFFKRISEAMKTEIGKITPNMTRGDLREKLKNIRSEIDNKLQEVTQQNGEPVVDALSELQGLLNAIFKEGLNEKSPLIVGVKAAYAARVLEAERLLSSSMHKDDDVLLQDNGSESKVTRSESRSTSTTPPNTPTTDPSDASLFPKTAHGSVEDAQSDIPADKDDEQTILMAKTAAPDLQSALSNERNADEKSDDEISDGSLPNRKVVSDFVGQQPIASATPIDTTSCPGGLGLSNQGDLSLGANLKDPGHSETSDNTQSRGAALTFGGQSHQSSDQSNAVSQRQDNTEDRTSDATAPDDNIKNAMEKAIEATTKSYGRWGDGGQKTTTLQAILGAYSYSSLTSDSRKRLIKEFVDIAIEPRSPFGMFGRAEKGYTKSAMAFYQALTDDEARTKVAVALGGVHLDEPDGNNQSAFADLANSPPSAIQPNRFGTRTQG